jgi:hypothetical protein
MVVAMSTTQRGAVRRAKHLTATATEAMTGTRLRYRDDRALARLFDVVAR